MYVAKIEIHPIRDGEVASGAFIEEKLRNGTWIRVREFPFISSDGTGVRNFALEDDARLIIAARSNVETRLDRAQMAHVTVQPNGQLVHPAVKKYIPPPHEDEGTNDTGVSLAELSAREFEEMKRRELLERVRREKEAEAQKAAAIEAAREAERKAIPPIRVRETGE